MSAKPVARYTESGWRSLWASPAWVLAIIVRPNEAAMGGETRSSSGTNSNSATRPPGYRPATRRWSSIWSSISRVMSPVGYCPEKQAVHILRIRSCPCRTAPVRSSSFW